MKHYTTLLQSSERFANLPVAVAKKPIKLFYGENVKGKEVYAAHLQCDAAKKTKTNTAAKALYNRKTDKDVAALPEGKWVKYIECLANKNDRRPPPGKYQEQQLARVKQAQFQEKHTTATLLGVTDLDLPLDIGNDLGKATLRQLILGIKTQNNWLWPLYLSVDVSWRGDLTALYHTANEEEAHTILDYLPVFLEARFGERIWSWFSCSCRDEMSLFKWDAEQCKVVEAVAPDAADVTNLYGGTELADWEQVDDADLVNEDAANITFDLGQHFNLKPRTDAGAGFDDGLSLASMRTGVTNATLAIQQAQPDPIEYATSYEGVRGVEIFKSLPVGSTASGPPDIRGVQQGSPSAPAMAAIFTTTAANAASKRMTGVGNDNE